MTSLATMAVLNRICAEHEVSLTLRAEKRGLLRRVPNPADGRAVDVFITPRAAVLADRVRAEIEQALSPMTDELTVAEQRRLHALLQRMQPRVAGDPSHP